MLYLIKQLQNEIYGKCWDFYASTFKFMYYTEITYVTPAVQNQIFFVTSTKLLSCSLPQSARIEWSVSAGGLIQQTSKMAVW